MLSIALSVKSPDDVMDSYDKQIEMSITSFPTDLIIYGDDCNLRKKLCFDKYLSFPMRHLIVLIRIYTR